MTRQQPALAQDRCIVLPFPSESGDAFAGAGLALHFLLGNVLVLHPDLRECWFGWRVTRIFPEFEAFSRYCRGEGPDLDLREMSARQNIRFWVSGHCQPGQIEMQVFDAQVPESPVSADTAFSCADDLLGFRSAFLACFGSAACPFPESRQPAALWPEKVSSDGLEAVGAALLEFYRFAFTRAEDPIDLALFHKAAASAPASFTVQELPGWALFRDGQSTEAAAGFHRALEINPNGAGAMAGLMWCALQDGDRESSVYWAGRKAEVCSQDVQAAREKARQRFEKT